MTTAAAALATVAADTATADPRWGEIRWALLAVQNAGLHPRSHFDNLRDCIYVALIAENGWTENTWETADRLTIEIWEEPSPEAAPALTEAWALTTITAAGLTRYNGVDALKGALLAALNDDDLLDDETAMQADDLAWLIHEAAWPDYEKD